jgi:hypothetical protein
MRESEATENREDKLRQSQEQGLIVVEIKGARDKEDAFVVDTRGLASPCQVDVFGVPY